MDMTARQKPTTHFGGMGVGGGRGRGRHEPASVSAAAEPPPCGAPHLFLHFLKQAKAGTGCPDLREKYLAAVDPVRNGQWILEKCEPVRMAMTALFDSHGMSARVPAASSEGSTAKRVPIALAATSPVFFKRPIAAVWLQLLQTLQECAARDTDGLGPKTSRPIAVATVLALCELCQRRPDCETLVLAVLYGYVYEPALLEPEPIVAASAACSQWEFPPWFGGLPQPQASTVLGKYVASLVFAMNTLRKAEAYVTPDNPHCTDRKRPSQTVVQAALRRCMLPAQILTRCACTLTLTTTFHWRAPEEDYY
jgi:hypothetical protein